MNLLRRLCVVAMIGLATQAAAQEGEAYQLEPGDTISISVLEDPGLNTTALIRPDGLFSMPLAGTIRAEGRTPEEVQGAVRRALAGSFLEPPTVTVSLTSLSDVQEFLRTIYVIGEVARPGAIELQEGRDVGILQALALAGGPSPFAATKRIQLRRRDADGGDVVYFFNYEDVTEGLVPTAELDLVDGDVIVVPERGLFE